MARTLYQKFRDLWKNKPDKTTPVTAEALNHIENGILKNSENMALKEIYGDTAISLGRKQGSHIGYGSYAFGGNVEASADYAHADGICTIARQMGQHVQGMFNIEDTNSGQGRGTYAHIVGNGKSDSQRSNAHTLDWEGNAWFAGDVTNGSGVSLNCIKSDVDKVKNIAEGASAAKVFNTKEELEEWLAISGNPETLKKGQNIYIVAKDTPDYWWDGTGLQELETGKVIIEELSYDETMNILDGSGVA